MEDQVKVPHIKAGSQVSVLLDMTMLNGLHKMYDTMMASSTKEEADKVREKMERKEPLQPSEINRVVMTNLFKLIYESAARENLVEYKPLEQFIKETVS